MLSTHSGSINCLLNYVSQSIKLENMHISDGFLAHLSRRLIGELIYLVQKETQCFYLHFGGLKIIDFTNCFNSVVLPSIKVLDCKVSS